MVHKNVLILCMSIAIVSARPAEQNKGEEDLETASSYGYGYYYPTTYNYGGYYPYSYGYGYGNLYGFGYPTYNYGYGFNGYPYLYK